MAWWVDRWATGPTPLVEKMALFWHGHFATSQDKVFNAGWMFDQTALFRTAGLGSFEALAQAVSVQPAMLVYLDNCDNVRGHAQENFARELMELFLLGVGQYSQTDVTEVARAWTGHGIDWNTGTYVFRSTRHDAGLKTIFGVTKAWDGPDVIHHILGVEPQRSTAARFLAGKLWTDLAGTTAGGTLLDDLAASLTSSSFDITTLLRTILLRDEFFGADVRQGLLRQPVEHLVAIARATGVAGAQLHPEWWLDDMGQMLFYPPDVSGFRLGRALTTTATAWARTSFADWFTWWLQQNVPTFLAGTKAMTVAQAVTTALSAMDVDEPSAATTKVLTDWLTAERAAHGWAEKPYLTVLALLAPELQVI
jgi:uncharacterized protein (DUF1800 family)